MKKTILSLLYLTGVFSYSSSAHAWTSNLTVATVSNAVSYSIANKSSTKLTAAWTTAPDVHPLYSNATAIRVRYEDEVTHEVAEVEVAPTATSVTLEELKAATTYTVSIRACYNGSGCPTFIEASDSGVPGLTYPEAWQIQDSGSTSSLYCAYMSGGVEAETSCNITNIEQYSNAKASGFMDANGDIRLYYDTYPNSTTVDAITMGVASSTSLDSVANSDTYGLKDPSALTGLVRLINTAAPVLLDSSTPKVRLFFEAADNTSAAIANVRIVSLDSVSGTYNDFDSSSTSTICSNYGTGSTCEPSLVIGVDSDSADFRGIKSARQLRVGHPMQTNLAWDESDGTFMIFTASLTTGGGRAGSVHCHNAHNLPPGSTDQGYAVYSSGVWNVKYSSTVTNCPILFKDMQAPSIVHLKANEYKYKLYFGTPSVSGAKTSCNNPYLGPKRMLYADGANGPSNIVDYEDWEPKTSQREINFLWPNGTSLSPRAEGYIDDFEFIMKTGDQTTQMAYLTITDGRADTAGGLDQCSRPIVTYAKLLNP